MKLETAMRNAARISKRLHGVNGLIGTPNCQFSALRVRRVWVFGSTVKGSEFPNDLDVLLESFRVGRHQTTIRGHKWMNACVDSDYRRRHGMRMPKDTKQEAFKWLRAGMKMVRLHDFEVDGDLAKPRVMIYPRNDLEGSQ